MKKLIFLRIAAAVLIVALIPGCKKKSSSAPSGIINTVAGNGYGGGGPTPTGGYSGDGGKATAAELYAPFSMAVDNAGNIYIADEINNVIRKVNTAGIISTVAGSGYEAGTDTGSYGGDGGAATAAELNGPTGVAVDASGNIYIADAANNRIRKVNTSGMISTLAGNGAVGYSGDGGPAASAELSDPIGIALDATGNVYIADYNNSVVRRVNTSGVIGTFAGNHTAGYNGDGFAAVSAELNFPAGVAADNAGNIYIADAGNGLIREVNTSGIISSVAGNGNQGYNGDGIGATLVELFYPLGVAVDNAGNIYIADYANMRIRKVNTSGIISTIAGNGYGANTNAGGGYSGDGGAAVSAELNFPSGVAVDATGNVYIADVGNNRIRKVTY